MPRPVSERDNCRWGRTNGGYSFYLVTGALNFLLFQAALDRQISPCWDTLCLPRQILPCHAPSFPAGVTISRE